MYSLLLKNALTRTTTAPVSFVGKLVEILVTDTLMVHGEGWVGLRSCINASASSSAMEVSSVHSPVAQIEHAAAARADYRHKIGARHNLHGCPQRVAHRQTDEGAPSWAPRWSCRTSPPLAEFMPPGMARRWKRPPPRPTRTSPKPEAGSRKPNSEGTPLAVNASETDYAARRIALGLPNGAPDLEPQKTLALEPGLDELHGITWDKARYMGQELTARTKYRGPVKRQLVPIEFSAAGEAPGTPVMAEGQEVGDIRSCGEAGPRHPAAECAGEVTYCWRRGAV